MSKQLNPVRCPFDRAGILRAAALSVVTCFAPTAVAEGTAAWRFQMVGTYAMHSGAAATDGTVYVQDVLGTLYALSPAGQLRWTYETGGMAEGPVILAADGTVIVSGNPAGADVVIHAVNPDGTNRWTFADPGATQGIIAGPAVGPDGNVYAVTDFGGLGVFSVSGATGELRWSTVGNPQINERGQTGVGITFGSPTAGGAVDQFFVGFDMFGTESTTGLLFGFTLNGSQRMSIQIGGDANVGQFQPAAGSSAGAVYVSSLNPAQGYRLRAYSAESGAPQWTYPADGGPTTNALTQPTVGPDGAIYIMRNLGQIHAVNPNGTNRWTHATSFIFDAPCVDPTNQVVVAGGRITYGQPGFVKGLNAGNGTLLWTLPLPDEAGVRMIPFSRPWFSPDGRRAYITTTLPGSTAGGYLYAIDLADALVGDIDGDADVDLADLAALLSTFGACTGEPAYNPAADFDASGCVELGDLASLLAAFGT